MELENYNYSKTFFWMFIGLLITFVTGLTFSVLFYAYSMQSIMYVFAVTGLLFLVFAFLGKTINIDLSKLGSIFMMILIGLLIVSIINIFIGSTMLELVLSWVFVVLFLGITAYDMQKAKQLMAVYGEEKGSIMTALQLYLDFINIFIELLKLFGKNRD